MADGEGFCVIDHLSGAPGASAKGPQKTKKINIAYIVAQYGS